MKIVNILGGLGNQMFQYAFAVGLKAEFPDQEVKINTLCFRGYPLHNGFELDRVFDVELSQTTVGDLTKVAWPWAHYRLWQVGRRLLPRRSSMVSDQDFDKEFSYEKVADKSYFDGYWQSPRFFEKHRESVVKALSFPEITDDKNLQALDFIKKDKTAFIHVRRGDYINHPLFKGICTPDYYRKGIGRLKDSHGFKQFVVFSNDIDWCRRELSDAMEQSTVLFVDWNKGAESYRDMQLMSKCDGALIANSSFSWWGAWLSSAEVVLCPSRWTNSIQIGKDIFSDNWTKL